MTPVGSYPEHSRLRLIISGRVQGVGFRFAAYDEAKNLGLTGSVRNLPGGEVEMVAEGRAEDLKILSAWARVGPPSAHVTDVSEQWLAPTRQFSDFRIR